MMTNLDIAARVFSILNASVLRSGISGIIDYARNDYTKEDIVIIPRTMTGEGSVRYGQINVNIHVPDLCIAGKFKPNMYRLSLLTTNVVDILKSHYEVSQGYSWTIGLIDPPYKEDGINEHFSCVKLNFTVRNN